MDRPSIFSSLDSDREVSIYLIRHGESEGNLDRKNFGSGYNLPLTAHGIAQMETVASVLLEEAGAVDCLYCSSLQRSVQGASVIAALLGIPCDGIKINPYLDEMSIGEWNGKERKACLQGIAGEKLRSLGKWLFAPGGETGIDVQFCAYQWIREMEASPGLPSRAIIAVCGHGYWIRCFLQLVFGFEYRYADAVAIGQGSMSLVRLDDRGWHLEYLNRQPIRP